MTEQIIDIHTGELIEPGDTDLFPMLSPDPEIQDILAENLGGDIEASLLPRIDVPRGKSTAYELQTINGPEHKPTFEAIILGTVHSQAYWPVEFGQGESTNEPPLCSVSRAGDSRAVMIGRVDAERLGEMPAEWQEMAGTEGVDCVSCPLNQFGSHPSGDSRKACNATITLVLLREGHVLPTLMKLPPTSLTNFKAYGMGLTQQGARTSSVITRIGCETALSSAGIQYGKVTFELARPLDQRASIATNELRGTGGLVRGVITTLSSAEHVAALTTGASAPAVSAASGPFDDVEVKQADDLSLAELERLTQPEKK